MYDVVLLVDDSGSMKFVDDGSSIKDLKFIADIISKVIGLFDEDGISIRFLNNDVAYDGLTKGQDIRDKIDKIYFHGPTPLGRALNDKCIQPLFIEPLRDQKLQKPLMFIVLTDGVADDECVVERALELVKRTCNDQNIGNACVFQFTQLGKDPNAHAFLTRLDNNGENKLAASVANTRFAKIKKVFKFFNFRGETKYQSGYGDIIDTTSGFELERKEIYDAHGIELTPYLWILKLLLGAIDPGYDGLDEQ